jgi:hypothetical protein
MAGSDVILFQIIKSSAACDPETLRKKRQQQQASNDLRFADLELSERL